MRSVNVERMPRDNPRVRAVRKPQRPVRDTPPKNSGRRGGEREGLFAALVARAGGMFRRPVLLLSLGVVLFALVAALFASGVIGRTIHGVTDTIDAVIADAGFGISEIHLAGNSRIPPETILAALGMKPGESIFGAKLGQARNRIMALDWVASADVVRRYPDSIFVTIVEKRPFALWQSPELGNGRGSVAVVERTGGVITTQGVEKFARLPKLVGAGAAQGAADLVDAVASHRAVAARVAAYERQSERRWNLILNDGVVVKLPESNWARELDALEKLIIDDGILERDVVEIDLRSPSHFFFMLKSGDHKDVVRGKDT